MTETVDGEVRPPGGPPADQHSTAQLVARASEQLSRLVRDELALAKLELSAKARHAGVGVGLFGGGAVLVFYGVGVLIAAAVLGLAVVWPGWLAALVVGVAMFLLAGVLALIGRAQVKRAVPPVPEAATDGIRQDVATVRDAVRSGRVVP